eukprot:TRINITY_DN2620_c0_g2_i1.p2 TRINITY_DN2620_c0_g2~~TRINITY_DN2620_c0_g2_i1.p2  ORF type:complete len:106 (+),score=6.06 TRINITY_DN2620_c0_g2_i1:747-1064(+)
MYTHTKAHPGTLGTAREHSTKGDVGWAKRILECQHEDYLGVRWWPEKRRGGGRLCKVDQLDLCLPGDLVRYSLRHIQGRRDLSRHTKHDGTGAKPAHPIEERRGG